MDYADLGYIKPLYILPFDHRATFAKNMFNLASESDLNEEQKHLIREFKMLIYKGFKDAVEKLIPQDYAAILCDEEYGDAVLADAQINRFVTLLTVEKSGEEEFKFQYPNFARHIEKYHPTFAKVLVRYNPVDSEELKRKQKGKLKLISDFCHSHQYKFLLELLVLPTDSQLSKVHGNKFEYDRQIRPLLTKEVIKDFQDFSIEPDVWKLEGYETKEIYEKIIRAIKAGGRENVNLVVLGRGADEERVEKWLELGAEEEWFTAGPKVEGVIGFAVGRTVFWQALEKFYKGEIGKGEVIQTVSENFQKFYKVFTSFA